RVDLEEHVALLDRLPLLEVDPVQVAPHVRPHLDEIDRGDAGREVRVVGDVPLHGVTDRDGNRFCRRRLRGCSCAARRDEAESEEQHGTDAEAEATSPGYCTLIS